jgi:uncharacterized protein DUF3987
VDDEVTLRIGNQESPFESVAQEFGNPNAGPEVANDEGANQSSEPKPTLSEAAKIGLPGAIVSTVDPYTEADPAAILINMLAMFGNVIGRGPFCKVEETPHYTNLFTVLVGPTGQGRKGTSASTPKRLFRDIDQGWVDRIGNGLSSGEGIINRIRDPHKKDPGEPDKRLFLIEEEYAQALTVMTREGNILSPILRQAWDGNPLEPIVKTKPIKCKEPHVSIIGHITPEELQRQLNQCEIANGFANRFLWFYVKRSKIIPDPTGVPDALLKPLIARLQSAFQFAQSVKQMSRDPNAAALWKSEYPKLTGERSGLFATLTERAAPQVIRLSMIYALMDRSSDILEDHLKAALAVSDYSEQSVKMIFGDATGDASLDLIVKCGKAFKRVTRKDMWTLLGHNARKSELDRITNVITKMKLAKLDHSKTLIF